MKRSVPIFILSIIILWSLSNANAWGLSDIEWHWAKSMIQSAVSKGIIKGYSDGTFKPEKSVSFIEACAIAFRTSGVVKVSEENASSDWTSPYTSYYIIHAYDSVYKPERNGSDDPMTREKALYVLLKARGISFDIVYEKVFAEKWKDTGFSDTAPNASYSMYVKYAKDNKIVNGYDGVHFGYGKPVSRAEFVKMALGIFDRTNLKSSADYISEISLTIPDSEKYLTYSSNYNIQGQSFTDSTKIQEDGKELYNGRWYNIQSDAYYAAMNQNQTPITVSGSFGNIKPVIHTESDGWTLAFRDGLASKYSWNNQREIDIIRYNENFYFEDLGLDANYPVLGGIQSFQELKLIGQQLFENDGTNGTNITNIKTFIRVLFVVSPYFEKVDLYTALDLK
ncbi:MAG: hypothetical protein ACD_71C00179G0010 [uncultured bacterium (gcode 4)]|uniref:SLH domain-containing protein n=1 Tax=uncultured bacterium (gcode 4) TaxID=1234023 RepID=K1YMX1_9BACT|nr:MAG: hypothetical protein ACD_71C00179G0010 [uncultured bacterium (gcode 4)]